MDYSQYENIVSRMPIGLWVVVSNQQEDAPQTYSPIRIVEINPSAARILGTSAEPLSALGTQTVLQKFIQVDIASHCLEVMQTGVDRQLKDVRYQGENKILHLALNILHEGSNTCVILLQDTTAQKLASERLLHGQRVAHIGDWDWNLNSDTIHFSEELIRIFGVSSSQMPLSFERTASLIHPDDRTRVEETVRESMATLAPFSIYYRLLRADTSERVVHSIGHVETNMDEQPIRLWGTTQDVTERWLAEENLRTSESQLRAITGAARDAIVSFTHTGEITFWNPGAVRTFGVESDQALGMSIHNFVSTPVPTGGHGVIEGADSANKVDEEHSRDEEETISWSTNGPLEMSAHTYNGKAFPAEVSLGSWTHSGKTFYTAIIRNVTKRHRAETELQEFARQLEASNRELQDFAYIASHDLQEPLRKINAFSDRLRSKYGSSLDDTALDYLGRMQNAAQRMQVLINDLLTLSRVTTKGQPFGRTDLNAVLHAVLSDLETTIQQSDGEVIVENLPEIEADPLQMRQLFQNLISNALKFRSEEVSPVVRIYSAVHNETQTAQAPVVDTEGRLPRVEKGHCIYFADNGIGFDEKYLDRIFQPFQRLHGRTAYSGTGMGLAICRKIVERHNGTITAESTPGHGTTFIITLPDEQTTKQTRNLSNED